MKKGLLFSMAALLMAGITSCSNDDLLQGGADKPLEADTSFFANIAIFNTDAMTRASGGNYNYQDEDGTPGQNDYTYDNIEDPEFDKGYDYENRIQSVYLIFYDSDGNRVSTTQVRKDLNSNLGDEFNTGNFIYKGVVQIDVKHGSKAPAYVMCFVNPITSANFDINPDFETLDRLQETTRPRIIDDNGYFAMSKSVYFGTNRVSGEENAKIVATPLISSDDADDDHKQNLFTTEEAARNALANDGSRVDIYVERYAAKVQLSITNAEGNDGHWQVKLYDENTASTEDKYSLDFTPEYWAVNAYEDKTFICKSFLNDDKTDYSFNDLQKAFGNTVAAPGQAPIYNIWKWNNADAHRCYWAQTPAYYAANYPRVADDIWDAGGGDLVKGADKFDLRYYSYNDLKNNATGRLNSKSRSFANPGSFPAIYARENTVDGRALAKAYGDPNASPKAAIASAIIVGSYQLKKNGEVVSKDNNEDFDGTFYIAGNKVNGYTVYEDTKDMTDYFVRTTVQFALDSNGENTFFDYNETYKFTDESYRSLFTVVHPFKAAREDLVIDSRFVTIQLNPDYDFENTELYVYLEGGWQRVNEDVSIDEVNKQMLYAAGTVQAYNEGKVFYNIPIKHLGFYSEGNPNKGMTGTESTFNWTGVRSGDFGLVRNHSYSIVVDKIEGLGNGIPNPNDPIVPPTDPEEYYIGARIIVLNWALVPTQHVGL